MKRKIPKAQLAARCFFCAATQKVEYIKFNNNVPSVLSFTYKNYNYEDK